MRLFEFAAFYEPKSENGKESPEKPRIIVEPKTVLAKDEKQASLLAARSIPEEYVDKLEFVEIAVRPF